MREKIWIIKNTENYVKKVHYREDVNFYMNKLLKTLQSKVE